MPYKLYKVIEYTVTAAGGQNTGYGTQ